MNPFYCFVAHADAREGSRELATDNAVSALGALLEAQRDCLSKPGSGVGGADGVGQAWGLWLGYMPLGADEEEAEKVGALFLVYFNVSVKYLVRVFISFFCLYILLSVCF